MTCCGEKQEGNHCNQCGTRLTINNCYNCRRVVKPNHKHCGNCGARIFGQHGNALEDTSLMAEALKRATVGGEGKVNGMERP